MFAIQLTIFRKVKHRIKNSDPMDTFIFVIMRNISYNLLTVYSDFLHDIIDIFFEFFESIL